MPTSADAHRPTLAAVAARAGVSRSTASLAFSGAGPVAVETRERVLAAAAELAYAGPDPLAQSLRRGSSGVVGVIIGDRVLNAFRDPVQIALMDGVSEVLNPLGLSLLLLPGDRAQSGPSLQQVARVPLDAAIFETCGEDGDPLVGQLRRRGVPMVGVEGPTAEPDITLIEIDDRVGTAQAVQHLLDLGHQPDRIAVVALPLSSEGGTGLVDATRVAHSSFATVRRRLDGVVDALDLLPQVYEAGMLPADGERAARYLLASSPRPTAIVAQSDLLASGVITAARALGLRVPDDVSIVGFDGVDVPGLGDHVLTTVEQPLIEKGRLTGNAVAALLSGGSPANVLLPVRLRVGTTSGHAPT